MVKNGIIVLSIADTTISKRKQTKIKFSHSSVFGIRTITSQKRTVNSKIIFPYTVLFLYIFYFLVRVNIYHMIKYYLGGEVIQ